MQLGADLDLPYLTMDKAAFSAIPFPHFTKARAQHPWRAHFEECGSYPPITGECIDPVGGVVQRCSCAYHGFAACDHTIEVIAERWSAVMDEGGAIAIGFAAMDTSGWGLRAYEKD